MWIGNGWPSEEQLEKRNERYKRLTTVLPPKLARDILSVCKHPEPGQYGQAKLTASRCLDFVIWYISINTPDNYPEDIQEDALDKLEELGLLEEHAE